MEKKSNLFTKRLFRTVMAIFIVCTIFTVETQGLGNQTCGEDSTIKVSGINNTSLTQEQLLRVEEMAKDNSYIRDADEFGSVEAYIKYLEYRGEIDFNESSKFYSRNNNILRNVGSGISPMVAGHIQGDNVKKEITLRGLTPPKESGQIGSAVSTAIQAFYIGTAYVYTVQLSGKTVYLSRLTLSADKTEATYKDQMILNEFGHCQTLEYFEWKGTPYFLMSCKDDGGVYENEHGMPYYWCKQIARVPYEAGKNYSYTHYKRLCYIDKANKTGTSFGELKRCDAALSSDKKTMLVWCRDKYDKMQFARYNMDKINTALDNSSTNYVSCASSAVKGAWLATFVQTGKGMFTETETLSMQGLELDNANCTYVASGMFDANKYIIKANSQGYIIRTNVIDKQELLKGTETEIEGLQLKGDNVYFGICDHKKDVQSNGIQYIYSVKKSFF